MQELSGTLLRFFVHVLVLPFVFILPRRRPDETYWRAARRHLVQYANCPA